MILDDASHFIWHQRSAFTFLYHNCLRADRRSVYVVEDIGSNYWPKYGGNPRLPCGGPATFMSLSAVQLAQLMAAAPTPAACKRDGGGGVGVSQRLGQRTSSSHDKLRGSGVSTASISFHRGMVFFEKRAAAAGRDEVALSDCQPFHLGLHFSQDAFERHLVPFRGASARVLALTHEHGGSHESAWHSFFGGASGSAGAGTRYTHVRLAQKQPFLPSGKVPSPLAPEVIRDACQAQPTLIIDTAANASDAQRMHAFAELYDCMSARGVYLMQGVRNASSLAQLVMAKVDELNAIFTCRNRTAFSKGDSCVVKTASDSSIVMRTTSIHAYPGVVVFERTPFEGHPTDISGGTQVMQKEYKKYNVHG